MESVGFSAGVPVGGDKPPRRAQDGQQLLKRHKSYNTQHALTLASAAHEPTTEAQEAAKIAKDRPLAAVNLVPLQPTQTSIFLSTSMKALAVAGVDCGFWPVTSFPLVTTCEVPGAAQLYLAPSSRNFFSGRNPS